MPYPSEHASRQNDPGKYASVRRQNDKFGPGIDAIFGVLEDGKTELQAVRFDASRFSPSEAREWLKKHKMKEALEEASGKEKEADPAALETKGFRSWIAQPVSADRERRRIKMIFSTQDEDRDGEVVEDLDATDYPGTILWNHDSKQLPPAKMLSLEKDGQKWIGEAEFAKDVTVNVGGVPVTSKQLFEWYADGFLKGWSVGFIPTDRSKDKKRVKGKLVEVSMVPIGANPKALSLSLQRDLITKGFASAMGLLPEKASAAELAASGFALSEAALLKSIRERGLEAPEGWELEVEPLEVKGMEILQARVVGWRKKKATTTEDAPQSLAPPEEGAEEKEPGLEGKKYKCPDCDYEGPESTCPDCGAECAEVKAFDPNQERDASGRWSSGGGGGGGGKDKEPKDRVLVAHPVSGRPLLTETAGAQKIAAENEKKAQGLLAKAEPILDDLEGTIASGEDSVRAYENNPWGENKEIANDTVKELKKQIVSADKVSRELDGLGPKAMKMTDKLSKAKDEAIELALRLSTSKAQEQSVLNLAKRLGKKRKGFNPDTLSTKEGRVLSSRNRERLLGLMETIGKTWDELELLLKETAPIDRPRRTDQVHDVVDPEAALQKAKARALLAKHG